MPADYNLVLGQIKAAKVAGEPFERAEQIARSHGWTMDQLRAASETSTAGNVARSVGQGVTFGFGDELTALARTTSGEGYRDALESERAGLKRFQSTNPKTAMGAELVGAVAPGMAAAPLAVGKGLGSTALRMAAVGGAEGALYGVGVGETPQERLSNAQRGAVGGAIASPIIAGLGAGASAATTRAFSPKSASRRDITRALDRDEMTPRGLVAEADRLNRLKPGEATVADAGGEAMQGLVERAAQSAGAGRSVVKPFLEERQKRQLQRISSDLRFVTGTKDTARETLDRVASARKAAADPLYEEARAFDVTQSPELLRTWQKITGQGYGKDILASKDIRNSIESDLGISFDEASPMVVMDAFYKELGDRARAANLNEKAANKARVLTKMQEELKQALTTANPKYGEALDAWSGPSSFMDAVTAGQKIINMPADEVQAFMANASKAEREAFRTGAVSGLIARMERDGAKLSDYTKYFRSEGMRKKMDALLGDAKKITSWRDLIGVEEGFTELTATALANSATARRLMQQADAEGADVFDVILTAADGTGLQAAVRRWLTKTANNTRDTLRSRVDKLNMERLLQPDAQRTINQAMSRPALAPISERAAGAVPAGSAALISALLANRGAEDDGEFPY